MESTGVYRWPVYAALQEAGGPVPGPVDPFTAQIALLATIAGVGQRVATVVVSEIGVDMSRFRPPERRPPSPWPAP